MRRTSARIEDVGEATARVWPVTVGVPLPVTYVPWLVPLLPAAVGAP